jgi:DNA end-binding protein Ku
MDTMTRDDLEGPEFRDSYTEAVAKLIEAKREHLELAPVAEPAEESGQLVDLMAALNESVAKAKERRSGGGDADVHEMPTKRTAKKAPAKKTAAKKTARKPRRSA